jgi:hypothetical protein
MFGKKMLVWLISHQPTVLFSRNKPATNNQPAVLFSQNKSAPAISHHPNEQAKPVRSAYQPPASSTFLSERTSHQQPASSTLLSEQTSTSHQPPTKRTGQACSLGLSATSQQYFSLRTNQPPATSRNQPAVLFSQNKPAPAISHQLGRLFALCTHHSQNWQSNKFRPVREIDFGMTNLAKQHFCKNSVCTSSLEFQIMSVQFVLHSEHFRFSKT